MAAYFPDLELDRTLDEQLRVDFPAAIDTLVATCKQPTQEIKKAVAELYTKSNVGIYWNPVIKKAGVYIPAPLDLQEYLWTIQTLGEKLGAERVQAEPLTGSSLQDWWVKVAYSPTLRRLGEIAQFFPSRDIPGFGGRPIASTIASGLLGAGLGYGAGYIGEQLIPSWAKDNQKTFRRRLAALGGLGGLLAGAAPGFVNWHQARAFNDPTLWQGFPDEGFEADLTSPQYKKACVSYCQKQATLSSVGGPSFSNMPLIELDSLGRVMWGAKTTPQTTAMTLGAVYGASQMPDPSADPGTVTPHQFGLLGTALGAAGGGVKGYITGRAIGYGLGLLTGMPESTQQTLARTGAAAGVLNTLVPRLFY